MDKIGAEAAEEKIEREVIHPIRVAAAVESDFEIGRQSGKLGLFAVEGDQDVTVLAVHGGQRVDQVADVGSDAEIAEATNVDGNAEGHYRAITGPSFQA
jgi:hypothetical protein